MATTLRRAIQKTSKHMEQEAKEKGVNGASH